MYRIALVGKANSGKNTTSTLILNNLEGGKTIAFADPIKEIIKIMFPHVKKKHLYGSSKFRNTIIDRAKDKDGNPLTIRQALIEIGTGLGRGMNEKVWLDVFDDRFSKLINKKTNAVIVSDCRFRNEFDHLRNKGFFIIKIKREDELKINHISETNQDLIKDNEFHFVLNNDGTIDDLDCIINGKLGSLLRKGV